MAATFLDDEPSATPVRAIFLDDEPVAAVDQQALEATPVAPQPSVPPLTADINRPAAMTLEQPLPFLPQPDFRAPFEAAQQSYAVADESPLGYFQSRANLGIGGLSEKVVPQLPVEMDKGQPVVLAPGGRKLPVNELFPAVNGGEAGELTPERMTEVAGEIEGQAGERFATRFNEAKFQGRPEAITDPREMAEMTRWQNAQSAFGRSLTSTLVQPGQAAEKLNQILLEGAEKLASPEGAYAARDQIQLSKDKQAALNEVQAGIRRKYKLDPRYKDEFLAQDLPSGAGSLLPFVATGTIGGPVASAALGSMLSAQQEYEAARAAGASEEVARKSMGVGALIGLTEAAGVGRGAKAAGGSWLRRGLSIAGGATEEGAQEGVQVMLSTLNASYLTAYDPAKRSSLHEIMRASAVGAVLGGGVKIVGLTPEVISELQSEEDPVAATEAKVVDLEMNRKIAELWRRKYPIEVISEELGITPQDAATRLSIYEEAEKGSPQPIDREVFNEDGSPKPEFTYQPPAQADPDSRRWRTTEMGVEEVVDRETGIARTPDGPVRVTEEGVVPLTPVEQASLRSLGRDLSPPTLSRNEQDDQTTVQTEPQVRPNMPQSREVPVVPEEPATQAPQSTPESSTTPVEPSMAPNVEVEIVPAEEVATSSVDVQGVQPVETGSKVNTETETKPESSTESGISPGDMVRVAGAQFTVVKVNPDGTYALKGEAGEFDTNPGERVTLLSKPAPKTPQQLPATREAFIADQLSQLKSKRMRSIQEVEAEIERSFTPANPLPFGASKLTALLSLSRPNKEQRALIARYNNAKSNAEVDTRSDAEHAGRVFDALQAKRSTPAQAHSAATPAPTPSTPTPAAPTQSSADITKDVDAFAGRVNQVAHSLPESALFGPIKAWISEVYAASGYPGTLAEFKQQLLRAKRAGKVALSRYEMPGTLPATRERAAASEIQDGDDRFNFVTLTEKRDRENQEALAHRRGEPTAPAAPVEQSPAPAAAAPEPSEGQDTTQPPAEPPAPPVEPVTPPPADNSGDGPVGMRHAYIRQRFEDLGLPQPERGEVRKWDQLMEEARAILANDPDAASRLVETLFNEPRPIVADRDTALILHEFLAREAEVKAAATALNESANASQEVRNDRIERFNRAVAANQAVLEVARSIGSERGRALNAQKMFVNRDFTLARITAEILAAKGAKNGEGLSAAEIETATNAAAEVQRLKDKVAELEAELQEERGKVVLELIEQEEVSEAPKESAKKEVSKRESRILKALDEKAAEARKNLRGKVFQLGSNPDLSIIGDMAVIGASYIAHGARNLTAFTARLVKEFGEAVRPLASRVYDAAKAEYSTARKEAAKQTADEVIQDVKVEEGLTQSVISELVRAHLRAGVKGYKPVISAVTTSLKPKFPDVTESEVRRVFSDYGNVRYPSRDELETETRRLKTLSRLQSQLEDVLKRQAPKKTGYQRDNTDAEIRELQKQINDKMRELGITVTDPETQKASGLAAAKRRMSNEIEEIEQAIKNNQRRTGSQRTLEFDEEAKALQQQLTEARARYDEAFPAEPLSAEEQAARALTLVNRQIAEEEAMLLEGVLRRPGREPSTLSTPELDNRRMELAALRQLRRELYAEANPGKSPEQQALEAAMKSAQRSLDRYSQMLATGDLSPRAREQRFQPTAELTQLRKERDDLADMVAELRKAARPKTTQDERTIKALEKSIAAMDEALLTGNLAPKGQVQNRPESQRATELRELRDQMAKTLAEARKEARPKQSDAQKEQKQMERDIKALDKEIARLDERIRKGDFTAPQRKQLRPEVQVVAQRRAIRDAMREAFNNLKKAQVPMWAAEARRQQVRKRAIERRTQELEKRIALGDYAPRPKREAAINKDIEKALFEQEQVKREFYQGLFEYQLQQMDMLERGLDFTYQTAGIIRAVTTSFDLGAIRRQGGLAVAANPSAATAALRDTIQAVRSEQGRFAVMERVRSRENSRNGNYRRAKLRIVDETEASLSKVDEEYQTRWAKKVWGVSASERGHTTFLNVLRAEIFDTMLESLPGATTEEMEILANYINVATGHGRLGKHDTAAKTLNLALWSTSFYASRIQWMTLMPLLRARKSKRVAKLIGAQYARSLAGLSLYYGLLISAAAFLWPDDEKWSVGLDPRSSDFLKVRIGDLRFDPMSGLTQFIVFGSRILTGMTTSDSGERAISGPDVEFGKKGWEAMTMKFVRSKLNPVTGTAFDHFLSKESYDGRELTLLGGIEDKLPMSLNQTYEILRDQGFARGTILTMMGLVGEGVQVHNEDPKILHWMFDQPMPERVSQMSKKDTPTDATSLRRQLRKDLGIPSSRQLRKEIMGD